eukprot:UC1_evm1s716
MATELKRFKGKESDSSTTMTSKAAMTTRRVAEDAAVTFEKAISPTSPTVMASAPASASAEITATRSWDLEQVPGTVEEHIQTRVRLKCGSSAQAVVNLHGATVTSWCVGKEELLFVSKKAIYNGVKAIRGGIPIVFPCFGPWAHGPQHGFARITPWSVVPAESGTTPEGYAYVTFQLRDGEATSAWVDARFKALYTVTLEPHCLSTHLEITNTGQKTFDFTALLHTYLRVPDVEKVRISGLKGCVFADKVAGTDGTVETRPAVRIEGNVDRVYAGATSDHVVSNVSSTRARSRFDHSTAHTSVDVRICKSALPDTVVWNPGTEKAKAMADMGDEEYQKFVCVEAGAVVKPVVLASGESWQGGQRLVRETRA